MSEKNHNQLANTVPENSSTQEVTQDSQNTKNIQKKPTRTWLKVTFMSLVAVLILGVVAILPFGNQTVVARFLDSIGQSQAAFAVDMLASKNGDLQTQAKILSEFASIDVSKPDTCGKLWSLSNFSFSDNARISGKQSVTINPANNYEKNFNLQGFSEGNINLADNKVEFIANGLVNFDGDKWKEVSERLGANKDQKTSSFGQLQGRMDLSGALSLDNYFINLDRFGLFSDKLQTNFMLKVANKNDLTDKQKEGIKDITSTIVELLKTKPTDVFSEDTGKAIYTFTCQGFEKVSIEAPKKVDFGFDKYQRSDEVRPIVFTLKNNYDDIYTEKSVDLISKIMGDQKFKSFLKSKYPEAKKISEAGKKIFPEVKEEDSNFAPVSSDTKLGLNTLETSEPAKFIQQQFAPGGNIPIAPIEGPGNIFGGGLQNNQTNSNEFTKEDYEKSVDEFFSSFKKEDYQKSVAESRQFQKENYQLSGNTFTYYINMQTDSIYGSKFPQKITFTEKALKEVPAEYKEIIKDGFNIQVDNYDIKFNEAVPTINVPEKTN